MSKALADANLDIAYAAAHEHARRYGGEPGEYLSTAYLGLVNAAETFCSDKGATFRTHGFMRAHGAIRDEARRQSGKRLPWKRGRGKKHVSMQRPMGDEGDTLGDFISVKRLDSVASIDAVEYIVSKVAPCMTKSRKYQKQYAKAMRMVADGLTWYEAGRRLGLGETAISAVVTRFRRSK